jgi:hypothetical protein
MSTYHDQRRAKRQLRLRIGRLRRRIDRRVRRLQREGHRLVSWRTYVRRYPAQALAAAVGLGLAASAGLSGRLAQRLGFHLARRAVDRAVNRAWKELGAIWAESTPDRAATEPSGGTDGGS